MSALPDLDSMARDLFQDLRAWLAGEPADRLGAARDRAAEALTAARASADETVAERYRERTDALRDALAERRDAEPDDDGEPLDAGEITRRARVLDQTRDLSAASGRSVVAPRPEAVVTRRTKPATRASTRAATKTASKAQKRTAQKSKPTTPAVPVREIPGVGATLGSRLEKAGVGDAEAVGRLDPDRLGDILQVSPKRAAGIAEEARKLAGG